MRTFAKVMSWTYTIAMAAFLLLLVGFLAYMASNKHAFDFCAEQGLSDRIAECVDWERKH